MQAARRALEEGPWSKAPAADRAPADEPLADLIEANADELAELEALDNGKPVQLAKIVDVSQTIAWLRLLRRLGRADPRRRDPGPQPGDALLHAQRARRRLRPDHPVELPAADGGLEAGAGAGAGCTVVLKPAEQTPLTALRIGELALRGGDSRPG